MKSSDRSLNSNTVDHMSRHSHGMCVYQVSERRKPTRPLKNTACFPLLPIFNLFVEKESCAE